MTALPPPIAEKCAKALGQLSSPHDGQVVAGARGLVRILEGAGLQITDLMEHVAAPPREVVRFIERAAEAHSAPKPFDYGSWRRSWAGRDPRSADRHRVTRCQQSKMLSTWEATFLASIAQHLAAGRELTPKQRATLDGISAKVGAAV